MGKPTGFLEYPRKNYKYRSVNERKKDYKEQIICQPREEIQNQGARCMNCGIPYCHSLGCPVYNLIPEWNDLVYRGQWKEAYHRLELTNNLPEITGRLCPAPCEPACTLSINTSPITIKQIELFIIENAFKYGWVVPRPPKHLTGKKIAVIGSGPAGLAAAQQLRRSGHNVVVFEKARKIGGILRYGIPDFKLEKKIIDRRLDQMINEGVEFETDVAIGDDLSARYLKNKFDIVLLTLGAGQPRDLPVPGRESPNIHFAMDFLTLSNKFVAGEIKKSDLISANDKNVLVLGGGDTGSDCVGTSVRQGAKKIYQYEILDKPLEWTNDWNPDWPEWPVILRTSTSHEEGCERDWGICTKQFTDKGNKTIQANFIRVKWDKDKKTGRFQMSELPSTEFSLDIQLVLLALGFVHVEHNKLITDLNISLDNRKNILTDHNYMTNIPGVFAAGDADIGASLIVRAIFHGRQAADAINRFLD